MECGLCCLGLIPLCLNAAKDIEHVHPDCTNVYRNYDKRTCYYNLIDKILYLLFKIVIGLSVGHKFTYISFYYVHWLMICCSCNGICVSTNLCQALPL